jgi:PAS domain S-box-containing protein
MVVPEDRAGVGIAPGNLEVGRHYESVFRIMRADGEVRWLTSRSVIRANAVGQPVELVGVSWDITDQKVAQQQLAEAEHRLALATTAAGIGVWDWDVPSGTFFYSPQARLIYGFPSDEMITFDNLRAKTHPEDYEQVASSLQRALDPATRARETYRYRISRADNGEQRWVLAHGGAVFSGPGPDATAVRYTGTIQDVTEEANLKSRLEDEQARLRLALAAGELAVWELWVETNRIVVSRELNRLYRFPDDAHPTIGDFRALYAAGERERVEAESAASFAAGDSTIRYEAKHLWPDGVVKWIAVRAQVISNSAGQPVRVLGVAMDVTQDRTYSEHLLVTARELQHRVKNSLAVVQSIASHTFKSAASKEDGVRVFTGRLRALGVATDLLTRGNWSDVTVRDLVEEIVRPYRDEHFDQFSLQGSALSVDGKNAVNLGMALHELSTNAIKYGALSTPSGHVSVTWHEQDGAVILVWQEAGGPEVLAPSSTGFGTKLLRALFSGAGMVDLEYRASGVRCRLAIPR